MKYLRFIKEFIKWSFNGRPIRTPLEIKRLYKICEACPNYDEYAPECGFGTCKLCGCNINKEQGLNKLAWGTTKCPDKPPRWG